MRILLFLILSMHSLSAQKVGVVDIDSVLLVMQERAALDSIMTEVEGIFILHIAAMRKKLEQTYQNVMLEHKHSCYPNPAHVKKQEDSLMKLQEEYQAYMSSIEDFQFILEQKIKDYQDGVLHGAVTRVAIVGNYQYILAKKEFLYFDSTHDLSTLVINELYRRPRLLLEQNIRILRKELKRMIQEHFLGKNWMKK